MIFFFFKGFQFKALGGGLGPYHISSTHRVPHRVNDTALRPLVPQPSIPRIKCEPQQAHVHQSVTYRYIIGRDDVSREVKVSVTSILQAGSIRLAAQCEGDALYESRRTQLVSPGAVNMLLHIYWTVDQLLRFLKCPCSPLASWRPPFPHQLGQAATGHTQ